MVESVYLKDPNAIEFSPGALDGLRMVRDAGFVFAMITNQSGVACRYFDADDVERIHRRVQPLVRAEGVRLETIYFCPRGPEDQFDCRMPSSGKVYRTMRDLGFLSKKACPEVSFCALPLDVLGREASAVVID